MNAALAKIKDPGTWEKGDTDEGLLMWYADFSAELKMLLGELDSQQVAKQLRTNVER